MLRVPQLKKLQQQEPYLYEALQRIVGAVNSLGNRLGVDPAPVLGAAAATAKTVEQSILPASGAAVGTWTNAGYCLFGNANLGRTHTVLTDATPSLVIAGFATPSTSRTALRLEVASACTQNVGGDPVTLDYSLDGGATFTPLYTQRATFAQRLDNIPLAPGQDVTRVQVRLRMSVSAAHTLTLFAPRLIESVPAP